jgi:hypothetical protein
MLSPLLKPLLSKSVFVPITQDIVDIPVLSVIVLFLLVALLFTVFVGRASEVILAKIQERRNGKAGGRRLKTESPDPAH